jgi:ATP-binding cassette subfamily B protein
MDCGAACLGMLCQAFGRKVSLSRIRQLCNTGLDGTSLNDICRAATELGLAARALKVSMRNLDDMPLPAIVHWEGNHWIVLLEVKKKSVRVADPAVGIRRHSRQTFEQKWSGYAALFDFTADFQNAPMGQRSLSWLAPLVLKLRGTLSVALGLALVVSILELLFPIFNQVVVDNVIVENDLQLMRLVLLAMGATILFCQLATLLQQYLLSFAALRIDTALLDFITVKMLSLPMSYFSNRRTGDIQRRLEGASQVRRFMLQHGIGGVLAMVHLVGALALMSIYSVYLTGVFLATMPLYAGLMWFSVKVLKPLFADIEESQGKYSSHQIDAIKGIEAVKAASAEIEGVPLRGAKDVPQQFHCHVVRQHAADNRPDLRRAVSLVRSQSSFGRSPEHRRLCRFWLPDGDGLRCDLSRARGLGQPAIHIRAVEPAGRYF